MMSIAVGNAASFYEQRIDHLVKPSRVRPKGNPHSHVQKYIGYSNRLIVSIAGTAESSHEQHWNHLAMPLKVTQQEHEFPHANVQEPERERNSHDTTKGQQVFDPCWLMTQCGNILEKAQEPLSNIDMLESLAKLMRNKVRKPIKSHSKGESKRRFKGPRTLSKEYRMPNNQWQL